MMKQLLFCLALACVNLAFSQTKQIAHKSHSGSKNAFFSSDYIDNFGEPPEIIDSIIILKNKCIVEIFTYQFYGRDTVCEHPFFTQGLTEAEIRAKYPEGTTFIGFENYKPGKKHKAKKTTQKSSFHYLAVILVLGAGAGYIFKRQKNDA